MDDIPVSSWSGFKSLFTQKRGSDIQFIQYSEHGAYYLVFFFEAGFRYTISLFKDGGADVLDFETVYKPTANDSSGINVVVDSSALPLGAATESTLSGIKTQTDLLAFIGDRLKVDANLDTTDIEIGAVELKDGATDTRAKIKSDGTDNAVVVTQNSQPLPTGASTEATLALIKAKTDNLDVTLSTRTKPSDTQTIAGTVTANAGTGNFTVTQATGTNLHTVVDSGSITVSNASGASAVNIQDGGNSLTVDGTISATQSGTWNINNVTGTISLPAGASTAANQTAANTSLASIDSKIPASPSQEHTTAGSPNSSRLSDGTSFYKATTPADTQPISGTVTANIGTSGSLALDASISGLQVSQGATTSGEKGTLVQGAVTTSAPTYTTGQTNPLSLTIAGAIRTDSSATTQPISAVSLPLPTGAATSANQTTANTSLSSIDGKLTHGQATMANSVPVVIASDQSSLSPALDLSTSGTITALNGSVALAVHGVNSAIVSLSGVWVASIQFQGMTPDGNWSNLTSALLPSGGLFSSAVVSVNGSYRLVSTAGYSQIRATATAYTSGTVTVAVNVATGQYVVQPVQLTAANLNAQVVGSTADAAAWTGNPVVVGGKDESGNAKSITSTLVDGKQSVDASFHPGNIASYMASTNGEVTTGTTLNTVNSIAYLWHPNTVTKRYEIALITTSVNSLSANVGYVSIRGARITALNGAPGGTNQTVNAVDQADAASGSTFTTGATGAPTRATGDYSTHNFGCAAANNNGQSAPIIVVFDERIAGKPLVLRASTNEGYEVRTNIGTALTAGVPVSATFYWREI